MLYTKNFKFSTFGRFDRIQPTPEIVNQLLQQFGNKGFIPSLINEIRVNPEDPQNGVAVRRIGLVNNNQSEQVAILSNRIDYELQYQKDFIINDDYIKGLIKSFTDVISFLFSSFSVSGNRLAINVESYAIPSEEDYQNVLEQFKTPVDFINENSHADYKVRSLIRQSFDLNSKPEMCNIITEIDMGDFTKQENDKASNIKGFIVHSDINTLPDNVLYRFTEDSISPFIIQAYNWWQMSTKGLY